MANIILFDDYRWQYLLPLTFTRPISELRIGILTIKEKWEKHLSTTASYLTQPYLSKKFPTHISQDNLLINSALLPDKQTLQQIQSLQMGQILVQGDDVLAVRLSEEDTRRFTIGSTSVKDLIQKHETSNTKLIATFISRPYDIFSLNGIELVKDFELVTAERQTQPYSKTNTVFGKHPIFLEEGVYMECCIINTHDGPVYLGKDTQIMEGSIIRGGFAACEGSIVKMGAKIYGPTTIGPNCRLGGEVNNSVFIANSNKGHDGFLGNSVIGAWCNLGADTNTSNLKNNYLPVKIWSYPDHGFKDTGLQFCGLIMGDHSKSGINTMFNTGTVVGVAANIFGDGFPRTYIPSFSWGGAAGFIIHQLKKALDTAKIVMKRRNLELTQEDINILEHIFELEDKVE